MDGPEAEAEMLAAEADNDSRDEVCLERETEREEKPVEGLCVKAKVSASSSRTGARERAGEGGAGPIG